MRRSLLGLAIIGLCVGEAPGVAEDAGPSLSGVPV